LQRLDDFGKLDRITQGKDDDDEKKEDEDEDGEEDNDNVEEEEEPDEYTKLLHRIYSTYNAVNNHSYYQETNCSTKCHNYLLLANFASTEFATTDETKGSNLGCHRRSKLSSKEKNQLLHKKKIIGFPTHRSCASPLLNSFDAHDLLRVVPTYHQDEDDQDAQHKAFQDDNPTITEVIHAEYSLNNNFKIETPMVIEEDEKLLVFTSTKISYAIENEKVVNKTFKIYNVDHAALRHVLLQRSNGDIIVIQNFVSIYGFNLFVLHYFANL
ncbi:hypothetical protein Tco_1440499, partial [Tanacetum coccineum]